MKSFCKIVQGEYELELELELDQTYVTWTRLRGPGTDPPKVQIFKGAPNVV